MPGCPVTRMGVGLGACAGVRVVQRGTGARDGWVGAVVAKCLAFGSEWASVLAPLPVQIHGCQRIHLVDCLAACVRVRVEQST